MGPQEGLLPGRGAGPTLGRQGKRSGYPASFIRKNVAGDTEAIYTDEWEAYAGVADQDTKHETVNHSEKEYVREEVHVNSVEIYGAS